MKKYVNSADINCLDDRDTQTVALIELLFFAYRDFVSDPDAMLEAQGFGRAHHRVLHFIGRQPGMTVAELLDILRITKQSLSRVLKDLVARQYVYQVSGESDRRQRLLYLTESGRELHARLMAPQSARIERAVTAACAGDKALMMAVLLELVSPENRGDITRWLQTSTEKKEAIGG